MGPKEFFYIFWNIRTTRVHRCWCDPHFQSSKTAGYRRWHGEWAVWGWPETLIHVHGCNMPGQYGTLLVNNIEANSLHMEFLHSSKARKTYCPSEMSHFHEYIPISKNLHVALQAPWNHLLLRPSVNQRVRNLHNVQFPNPPNKYVVWISHNEIQDWLLFKCIT